MTVHFAWRQDCREHSALNKALINVSCRCYSSSILSTTVQHFSRRPRKTHLLVQYVDALRLGNLDAFCNIEADSGDWWHVLLDRGAGAALHFAADHGQARFHLPKCPSAQAWADL